MLHVLPFGFYLRQQFSAYLQAKVGAHTVPTAVNEGLKYLLPLKCFKLLLRLSSHTQQ